MRNARRGRPTPRWGNFRRTRPFSSQWGFDRGLPVDRVYIEGFVERHAADIRGDVLEVMDSAYTERYGRDRVMTSHVLDVDAGNPRATLVGDLAAPATLPAAAFDCIVLTQTVQLIPDVRAALVNAWTALRPGGVLLVSVPTITKAYLPPNDYWRFTAPGLDVLLRETCPGGTVETDGRGNVLSAVAYLMGLAAQELGTSELELSDDEFHLVACGRAAKPEAADDLNPSKE